MKPAPPLTRTRMAEDYVEGEPESRVPPESSMLNHSNQLELEVGRVEAERLASAAPMARVTVEDCLEKEENRFALVVLAASRTRTLMKGVPSLVPSKNKPAVTALREIASGRVHFDRLSNEVVSEWIEAQRSAGL